jgi:inner membrane protein
VPSWLAHAPAAMGTAALFAPASAPRRYWVTAALCGIIPDVDFLGAPFGATAYSTLFGGHRGITHGIPFAIAFGTLIAWRGFRDAQWDGLRPRLALAFMLAIATHGLLDALTDNGPPVAFLSPLSLERYTFAWHPINPSAAYGVRGFARLPIVLANEFFWAGLPGIVLIVASVTWRRRRLVSLGRRPSVDTADSFAIRPEHVSSQDTASTDGTLAE